MNKRELIKVLEQFEDDMEVAISADNLVYFNEVNPRVEMIFDEDTNEEVEEVIILGNLT